MKTIRRMLFAILALLAMPTLASATCTGPFYGFGAVTTGGSGYPIVTVTNTNDSGTGSLRAALAAGNRQVVFGVSGSINLLSSVIVSGSFITLDGRGANGQPVSLQGAGLSLRGNIGASNNVHDMIVCDLRIRNATATASTDGITIAFGAYNIMIDHVSVSGSVDGNIDITFDSHDVTVQNSILADNGKNMLIKYNASRVTLFHNAFVLGNQRNPQARQDDINGQATDTTIDMRNNVVTDWVNHGTLCWVGARCNIVTNYYEDSNTSQAIQVISSRAWVSNNGCSDVGNAGGCSDALSTESAPFPAPALDEDSSACMAVQSVKTFAGAQPLDAGDQARLDSIAGCLP